MRFFIKQKTKREIERYSLGMLKKLLNRKNIIIGTVVTFLFALNLQACSNLASDTNDANSKNDTNMSASTAEPDQNTETDQNAETVSKTEQVDEGNKNIQIDIQTAVPFAPFYKIFYLESDDWGDGGLEQDETLTEKYMLNQIALQEGEHIVFLEIYDYGVSDYIEEVAYSLDNKDVVMFHCIIRDRNGNCIGTLSYDFAKDWKNKIDTKEIIGNMVQRCDKKINCDEPLAYAPRYYIYDLNEDGHVDLYDSSDIYLWTEEGYVLCPEQEKDKYTYETNCEIREIKAIEKFKTEYVENDKEDSGETPKKLTKDLYADWQVTYLQLKELPNAEKINRQMKDATDKMINTYFDLVQSPDFKKNDWSKENPLNDADYKINVCAEDIVYCGKNYLAVKLEGTFVEYPIVTVSDMKGAYGFQYLTFNLETGDMVTVADILGTDYTTEQITNLVWKGYKRSMEEVPDQYSKEEFNKYYDYVFNTRTWTSEKWPLELYIHYYFTDEGMVITYGGKEDFGMPVIYRLNECLEPIIYDNEKVIQIFIPWEDVDW